MEDAAAVGEDIKEFHKLIIVTNHEVVAIDSAEPVDNASVVLSDKFVTHCEVVNANDVEDVESTAAAKIVVGGIRELVKIFVLECLCNKNESFT